LLSAGMLSAHAGPMSWLTGAEHIQGNGKIIKQNREVSHFNALSGVSGDVDIRLGSTEGVTSKPTTTSSKRLKPWSKTARCASARQEQSEARHPHHENRGHRTQPRQAVDRRLRHRHRRQAARRKADD
jgi:hypothetical protein